MKTALPRQKPAPCGCHDHPATVGEPGDCAAVQVPISLLFVDPDRFQNRIDAFSELSAEAVAKHYDPNKFDPVVIWADPERGRTFVLSGHSRLEGMRRRGATTVPARYFAGTEAEAIQFARVDANRATTAENLVEDLAAYQLMRDGDEARALKPAKKTELNRAFKGKSTKLEAWSHLQPGGLFLNALGQDDRSQFPYLEKFALWVGQLRAKEADLTNTHEADCFNFLYADAKNQRLTREEFDELVTKRLAWGKPRLFPECDRGGCTDLKDLAKRGPQADSYREIEALAKYRETITHRLRSTDRSLRVYTEAEREKLKEQGQLIDLELKRLRRDLNQNEEAPGLFGPGLRFEWDRGNVGHLLSDHPERQLSLAELESAYQDPFLLKTETEQPYEPARYICVGRANTRRLLVMIVIFSSATIRIISAREANAKFTTLYNEANKQKGKRGR